MDLLYESSVLTSDTKKEGQKFWRTWAYKDESGAYTQTEAWRSTNGGGESKRVVSAPTKVGGKNTGKKNATTPEQQAVLEAQAEERKKRERKGYWILGESKAVDALDMPMLAQEFSKRRAQVNWGAALAQPKLDGIRCMLTATKAWSRLAAPFADEVTKHLRFDTGGKVLDGELILGSQHPFELTVSAVKRFQEGLSPDLEFHAYDCIMEGDYQQRLAFLESLAPRFPPNVKLVETRKVASEGEFLAYHESNLARGYEGTMLRAAGSAYEVGHRSDSLLKHKTRMDFEAVIIEVLEGTGKDAGTARFACKTPGGVEFVVRPKGEVEARTDMWENREGLVGKQITVQCDGFLESGAPRNPVGKAIRDGY